ncbi:MAG: PH domain-containing protein, partial [Candidatus Nanopelagicales bacterium]
VGTSVNDTGVKISRLRTTVVIPWSDVVDVDEAPQSHWLGLPLQVSGWTVLLRTSEGALRTHIATSSPDLWGRSQAADAAASTLRTWWRETR